MTVKALTFRTNESEIADIKKIASMFHMSVSKVIRKAVSEYIDRKKQSPIYRLANVEEASPEESAEILAMIDSLTDEDREIVRVDHIKC